MICKHRISALLRPCLALLCVGGFASAQESPTPAQSPTPSAEVTSLRLAIEKQAQQIEALTKEIAELKVLISRAPSGTPATGVASRREQAVPGAPAQPAAPATSSAAVPSSAGEGVETTNPAADGSKHTVAKGETLTSIAKRYNIPLAELQKTNQIQDDRKLQIGQVLKIPSAAKTPEPPNQTKENP